jgi:hypothetical protein
MLLVTGVTQTMAPAAPIRLRAVLLETRLLDPSDSLMTPPDTAWTLLSVAHQPPWKERRPDVVPLRVWGSVRREGLKLATRGQDREMLILRLFAFLTVACMTWLGILAALMNRQRGTDT